MKKENVKIGLGILGLFLISRALIFLMSYFSVLAIGKGNWYSGPGALGGFIMWDSGWYRAIVHEGYNYVLGQQSSVAFFPLYPLLVRAFSFWTPHKELIGFVISNVALILAAVYLCRLVYLEFKDKEMSMKAVLYMFIFPTSFFFSIFYTEGLFIFLAIASFYYARRKNWLAASLFGFFLSLTKPFGVLILIPLLLEYLDINFNNFRINFKRIKKDILYLLLVPAGLASYMAYLYWKFGDMFAFLHTLASWGRSFNVLSSLTILFKPSYGGLFYFMIFKGFAIFAILILIYLIYSKVRLSYIVYYACLLLVYLSSGTLESMPRYVGAIFPMYIGMSLAASKNKFLDYVFTFFSLALLTFFIILFVNGYWFT